VRSLHRKYYRRDLEAAWGTSAAFQENSEGERTQKRERTAGGLELNAGDCKERKLQRTPGA
jgi:hypothetical protein